MWSEHRIASRAVAAIAVCALWNVAWWALSWWVLPLDLPTFVRFGMNMSVSFAILWFVGPVGYGVRWLIADRRIAQRRK